MTRTLHIIASCSDRKRLPVPARLRLRSVRSTLLADRADRWWQQLSRDTSPVLPAERLYLGEHWAVCRTLLDLAPAAGYRPELWVASAGYGLVPANAALHAYSATFASGHPDSVVPAPNGVSRHELARQWWSALSKAKGPVPRTSRSLADLAKANPRASFLVIASPEYVAAMERDLSAAAGALTDSDRLLIVTSRGAKTNGLLAPYVIPSDAKLQAHVGGARTALHARVARKILKEAHRWELSAAVLQERYQRLVDRSPPVPRLDRDRLTDAEVRKYIEAELRRQPDASCSRLLRRLRDSGRACEQARFGSIFWSVGNAT